MIYETLVIVFFCIITIYRPYFPLTLFHLFSYSMWLYSSLNSSSSYYNSSLSHYFFINIKSTFNTFIFSCKEHGTFVLVPVKIWITVRYVKNTLTMSCMYTRYLNCSRPKYARRELISSNFMKGVGGLYKYDYHYFCKFIRNYCLKSSTPYSIVNMWLLNFHKVRFCF